MDVGTVSLLEVAWTAVSLSGAVGALWLLFFSARRYQRVRHSRIRVELGEQGAEELLNDFKDSFTLLFFIMIGARALTQPPPDGSATGIWPVALAVMIFMANILIGVSCWLRWRRRQ